MSDPRIKPRKMSWKTVEARYGRSAFDYRDTLAAQGGGCAICRRPPKQDSDTGVVERFAWDHDHSCCDGGGYYCGKCTRGLLCPRCNFIVGVVERNDLTPYQEYIKQWGSGAVGQNDHRRLHSFRKTMPTPPRVLVYLEHYYWRFLWIFDSQSQWH